MADRDVTAAVQAMQAQYKKGYDKAIFANTWGEAYKIGFETAVLAMTEQMEVLAMTEQMEQEQVK